MSIQAVPVLLVAATLAMPTALAAVSELAGPVELTQALLAAAPDSLRELEAVVGPLGRDMENGLEVTEGLSRDDPHPAVRRLVVRLAIDRYHQDPYKTLDPRLASYVLDVRASPEQASQIRAAAEAAGQGGRFRVSERATGVLFEWFQRPPPPSVTPREAEDLATRLVATIAAGLDRPAIERHLGALTPDPGWRTCDAASGLGWSIRVCPRGARVPEEVRVHLSPALPGTAVLAALGIEDPILMTYGVHMGGRRIYEADGRLPRFRRYQVEIGAEAEDRESVPSPRGGSLAWRAREFRLSSLVFERR